MDHELRRRDVGRQAVVLGHGADPLADRRAVGRDVQTEHSRRTVGGRAFQWIDDWVEPTWPGGAHPQQFHLDLATPDMDASEAAVIAAGHPQAQPPALAGPAASGSSSTPPATRSA